MAELIPINLAGDTWLIPGPMPTISAPTPICRPRPPAKSGRPASSRASSKAVGFEIVPLAGHFVQMSGILTEDGVLFLGDAAFGPSVLEKHGHHPGNQGCPVCALARRSLPRSGGACAGEQGKGRRGRGGHPRSPFPAGQFRGQPDAVVDGERGLGGKPNFLRVPGPESLAMPVPSRSTASRRRAEFSSNRGTWKAPL